MEHNEKLKWYDSGYVVISLIIGCILVIIFTSQSFAAGEKLSLELIGSVINHNSTYLILLIYFIFLNFRFGKKYFNYFNLLLVFLYFLSSITSFLTIISSFSLTTVLTFTINFVFFIYLIHTMSRGTRVWKEFHFSKSPFNELTNEWLFCCILVLASFLLAVRLISTTALSGVILSVLDSIYFALFARYIYLYREYLDKKKIDSNNMGNFDEVRDKINEKVEDASKIVQGVLDKTELDDKIVDGIQKVGKEIDQFIDDNQINKKVNDTVNDLSEEVEKVEEKIVPKTRKKTSSKSKNKDNDKLKGDE